MLRITQSTSAAAASTYFDEALSIADYYGKGDKTLGQWHGQAAEMIGLPGEVTKQDFEAVLNGLDPATGDTLDGVRHRENRTPGYDFTFSVPKSVSLYLAATDDERPRELFHQAVADTMKDIEASMSARVRKNGQDTDRTTGNALWATFAHETSRPVDGISDPHSHVHAYVANLTFDHAEQKWKAGQFQDLKRQSPLFQAAFHSRLAASLQREGYGVVTDGKSFQLAGVTRETIEKFSRRTAVVEATARENADKIDRRASQLMREGVAAAKAREVAKSELGGKTRESKKKGLSGPELREAWKARFTKEEMKTLEAVKGAASSRTLSPTEAVERASSHLFERQSVAPAYQVEAAALRFGCGLDPGAMKQAVENAISRGELLRGELAGRPSLTSRQVLADESRIVELCKNGQDRAEPLGNGREWKVSRDWLDDQQKQAVKHVLECPDAVFGIRGKAGTGKTTMMQECADALRANGREMRVYAPSSEAVDVLKREGFDKASTIQRLAVSPEAQREAAGKTLWIDEAGLVSAKQMRQVMDFARENNSRIILSGDRGQHRSVERGDTLAILEDRANIRTVELSSIKRQQFDAYREAASAFGEQRPGEGFDRLDKLGWVHQIEDRNQRIDFAVNTYFEKTALTHKDGKPHTASIIAPTHAEIGAVTGKVRATLKERGELDREDFTHQRLVSLNLTESQRRDSRSYEPGQAVEFVQNGKGGYVKGQQWTVEAVRDGGVEVERGGERRTLDLAQAKRFNVHRIESADFAKGDLVRATQNRGDLLNNSRHRIVEADENRLKLEDLSSGRVREVGGDYLHLTHAYAATSHASQGKTLDHVVISQPSSTFMVASQEQGYVSASRARLSATWITDDKAALREAVSRSEARPSALDLTEARQNREDGPQRAQAAKETAGAKTKDEALRDASRQPDKGRGPSRGPELER
ncbi:MobF family relaxase [Haloferula chungangensis]|uniref:MobF family relaxase n=1 Tax=Haloferula chungangensis TaxID=1048331 RepID=A0ABW2LAN6_9BACT